MTIEEAKELLWELIVDLSDEEIKDFIIQSKRMASIIVDFAQKNDLQ